ncbi:MAG: tetratricopeptide repeat protein [Bacteroidales bacterium]|nr:tetratricopeptide repeat protein [Bacteroidales bacterium]
MAIYENHAYKLLKNNEYDDAINYLSFIIDTGITSSVLFNNRGTAYYMLNKYAEALDDYNKAILLELNNHIFYYNRGMCLTKLIVSLYFRKIDLQPFEH